MRRCADGSTDAAARPAACRPQRVLTFVFDSQLVLQENKWCPRNHDHTEILLTSTRIRRKIPGTVRMLETRTCLRRWWRFPGDCSPT
eukprot:gene14998-biopygen6634